MSKLGDGVEFISDFFLDIRPSLLKPPKMRPFFDMFRDSDCSPKCGYGKSKSLRTSPRSLILTRPTIPAGLEGRHAGQSVKPPTESRVGNLAETLHGGLSFVENPAHQRTINVGLERWRRRGMRKARCVADEY